MSTTFYDSPEGAAPSLSIDVTHEYCWFFEHDAEGDVTGQACVRKEELPAIAKALNEFLETYGGSA